MLSRGAPAAVAAFLIGIGLSTVEVSAQFQPPGPPIFAPPPFRAPLPPVADDDLPPYDPPPGYRAPRGSDTVVREELPPPGPYGHVPPTYQAPPPGYQPPTGYEPDRRSPSVPPQPYEEAVRPPMTLQPPGFIP